jgi:putative transposase
MCMFQIIHTFGLMKYGYIYLLYLIIYLHQVIDWSLSKQISRSLIMNALRMAIWRRRPFTGFIFHSDRGSQYCSNDFQKMLKTHGMISSMSRKGNCWDNAVAESFFRQLEDRKGHLFKL